MKNKFKDSYRKFLDEYFSISHVVKVFQPSNVKKLKDKVLKEIVECIDDYLNELDKDKKSRQNSRNQNHRSDYEKLDWNKILVHSIEEWTKLRKELNKIFHSLKESSIDSLEELLVLWDKMNKFLIEEMKNYENWPEENKIQIRKKLLKLSNIIRDEKNINFIKCIQNSKNKEECKL